MNVNDVVSSVESFFRDCGTRDIAFRNEAELQHELGYWLRTDLQGKTSIYFERPAAAFIRQARGLVKREIDLVASPVDGSWQCAIELKCPRSGRVPETMFEACRDLKFLEQLVAVGFEAGLFAMHVVDATFFEAALQTGIYAFFRANAPLTGRITKPTGKKDNWFVLDGSYLVHWQRYGTAGRYWLQVVKRPGQRSMET